MAYLHHITEDEDILHQIISDCLPIAKPVGMNRINNAGVLSDCLRFEENDIQLYMYVEQSKKLFGKTKRQLRELWLSYGKGIRYEFEFFKESPVPTIDMLSSYEGEIKNLSGLIAPIVPWSNFCYQKPKEGEVIPLEFYGWLEEYGAYNPEPIVTAEGKLFEFMKERALENGDEWTGEPIIHHTDNLRYLMPNSSHDYYHEFVAHVEFVDYRSFQGVDITVLYLNFTSPLDSEDGEPSLRIPALINTKDLLENDFPQVGKVIQGFLTLEAMPLSLPSIHPSTH